MMKSGPLSLLLVLAMGCAIEQASPDELRVAPGVMDCVDRDGDGFGEGCGTSHDCDDSDPSVTQGCVRCAVPSSGCPCDPGSRPISCSLDPSLGPQGETMCHEGTRYCREGAWSGCESVVSYPASQLAAQGLIDPDAGPERCSDCAVDCFIVRDNLDPIDGGLVDDNSQNIDWAPGGGLTLAPLPDAGPPPVADAGVFDPSKCMLGVAPDIDCDGIPDEFDPYPHDKPFDTANPAIFLDIAPGEIGTGIIDLAFYINSADIYFLLDQTNSMAQERDQLKSDLVSGTFIDPSFNCADTDFDFQPNNELKDQGIIGAIRCIIRDSSFGTGFFREIPFSGYGPGGRLQEYVAFESYQDLTNDISDVVAAVALLDTDGNYDWPEVAGPALHNLVTGSGMYFGTRLRGIPPRTDCPALSWGYPCFRDGAIPIVIMFTDAQMHNGPPDNSFAYNATNLNITAGTDAAYHPLPSTNESFETVADLGDLTNVVQTFTGSTAEMQADLPAAYFGSCLSDGAGADAVFKFSLTQQRAVRLSSEGSRFDTVLGLFTGAPSNATSLASSDGSNETGASAHPLGDVTGRHVVVTGSTSGMSADLESAAVGCGAAHTAPDAVFALSLAEPARLGIGTQGSALDTVVSLHTQPPVLAPSYAGIGNANEDLSSPAPMGDATGGVLGVTGSTSGMASDYSAGQVGCGADGSAPDAVVSFDLTAPRRVRVSTEGSAFDTVVGLFDQTASPISQASVAPTNETQDSTFDVGVIDDSIVQLIGSTSSMSADYAGSVVGCSADTSARDAVFKFSLTSTRDVQIDTEGSSFDTVIGLFDAPFDLATTVPTANTNNTVATALDLGSVNGQAIAVTGGNTNSMSDNYDKDFVGCSYHNTAPEAAFKFRVDTATEVRLDTEGSGFDTVLSLFQSEPPPTSLTVAGIGNETEDSAYDVGVVSGGAYVLTGSTSGMDGDYDVGCSASASAEDAVFRFEVTTAGTYEFDTVGSSFDAILGLYPDTIHDSEPPAPPRIDVDDDNGTQGTAYDMGVLDDGWFRFEGDTQGAGHNWSDLKCGAHSGAEDAFFRFSLNSSRRVQIDTDGSSYDTVIILYRYDTPSDLDEVTCDHSNNDSELIDTTLGPGDYLLVVKGDLPFDEGDYRISFRDMSTTENRITCDDNSAGSSQARITRSLSAGTYHLVLKGDDPGDAGPYTVKIRDVSWSSGFGRLTCNNNGSGTGTASVIQTVLSPGEYWFLVSGYYYWDRGPFALRLADVTTPPATGAAVACSNDVVGSTSRITANGLSPGDYYVVLKGDASGDRGNYTMNVRDLSVTDSGAVIACDDDGGPDGASVIERDLGAGSYQVIIKGAGAAEAGAYKFSVRDVTSQPYEVLQCDADSGGAGTSYLERDLAAGTYFVTVKGDQPSGADAYSLRVRDLTRVPEQATTCNDNGGTESTSVISTTLNPGTYYVALKGKTADDDGRYQLTLGGGSTSSAKYVPPTWSQTLQALNDREVRVMSILSCHDDPDYGDADGDCIELRDQAIALANSTDALGSDLQPLVFDIDSDGSGLSDTVVDGVASLAQYLEMDVQVVVVFEPDANPGFNVTIKAADEPGDGCDGLIGQEHQRCVPGATPKFAIQFENPLSNPVPPNPHEPMFGGYNFKAQLIGDGQFIVDEVPIYIIPDDVIKDPDPPPPPLYEMGQYWQDVASPGCGAAGRNKRPDWHDLSWNAEVYTNTTVRFSACGGETESELETCTPALIATVTGGESCVTSADCAKGWCDQNIGVCQIATADVCSSDVDCPVNAHCDGSVCLFDSQPVYVGGVLGEGNRKSYLRMTIDLGITNPYPAAPVVHSWQLTYYCQMSE